VISSYRDATKNFRRRFTRIIKRAGLEPWPKLFHNLRASRATELAAEYPGHVAAAWLGHSTAVAQKHYWQVTEADFDKAASKESEAAQIQAQHLLATPCSALKCASVELANPEKACISRPIRQEEVGGKGLEPLTSSV
jgi:hypothetical protein